MPALPRHFRSSLFVLAMTFFSPSVLSAADAGFQIIPPEGDGGKYWPRWRGPSGQGLIEPGGHPAAWADIRNVRWKVAPPGKGNSSPIIWSDRIFLTTSHDDGKRRGILCLDRTNGKLLWEADAPIANPEKIQPKNGWASGTPSTDGTHIWAYFGNHGLLCVD